MMEPIVETRWAVLVEYRPLKGASGKMVLYGTQREARSWIDETMYTRMSFAEAIRVKVTIEGIEEQPEEDAG